MILIVKLDFNLDFNLDEVSRPQGFKSYSLETLKISVIWCLWFDLNPMILILKLDLDMVVTYLHAKKWGH